MAITYTQVAPTEMAVDPGAVQWQDYDIFTNDGVPKGAIAEVIAWNDSGSVGRDRGVRPDGSGLARLFVLGEAEDGGKTTARFLVTVHAATGIIELYSSSAVTASEYDLVGYWEGITFTELWSQYAAGADGAWTDADPFTDDGVPKGSTSLWTFGNTIAQHANVIGVRTDGSALNRSVDINEQEGGGDIIPASMFATVHADTGLVELYAEDDSDVEFFLQGYFGADLAFTEKMVDVSNVGVAATWETEDLTAHISADGDICDFLLTHADRDAENDIGVRMNGTAHARYQLEREAETDGYTGYGMTAQTDVNGVVELYIGVDATAENFWLTGYFTDDSGPPPVGGLLQGNILPMAKGMGII